MEIKFKTDNQSFKDDYKGEIIRILITICNDIKNGLTQNSIMDYNGNKVGEWNSNKD